MKRWLGIVAIGAAFACQTGALSQDAANAQLNDPGSAIQLTVTLDELSQGPTRADLPAQFSIVASRLPDRGGSVQVTWQALDGDPAAEPRHGSGSLAIGGDGTAVSIALDAEGRPPTALLTMTGTLVAGTVEGSFLDRLFSPRAGKFTAEIH